MVAMKVCLTAVTYGVIVDLELLSNSDNSLAWGYKGLPNLSKLQYKATVVMRWLAFKITTQLGKE